MVLVSYILYSYFSILQTKFSDREGHEARRVGLEAVPLDQHIEGGHGERQARLRPQRKHDCQGKGKVSYAELHYRVWAPPGQHLWVRAGPGSAAALAGARHRCAVKRQEGM